MRGTVILTIHSLLHRYLYTLACLPACVHVLASAAVASVFASTFASAYSDCSGGRGFNALIEITSLTTTFWGLYFAGISSKCGIAFTIASEFLLKGVLLIAFSGQYSECAYNGSSLYMRTLRYGQKDFSQGISYIDIDQRMHISYIYRGRGLRIGGRGSAWRPAGLCVELSRYRDPNIPG